MFVGGFPAGASTASAGLQRTGFHTGSTRTREQAPLGPTTTKCQVPRPPLIPANVTHVHFHVSFQACSASKVVSTEIPLFSWAI